MYNSKVVVEFLGSDIVANNAHDVVTKMEAFNFSRFNSMEEFREEFATRVEAVYDLDVDTETDDKFLQSLIKYGIVKVHKLQ